MKFCELGNIITITKGGKHILAENPSHSSKRLISIDDLRNDENIKYTDDKIGIIVDEGDVLIAWDGANAGTVGYGKNGYIGSTLARLRIKESIKFYPPYIGRFLQTRFAYLRKTATGATIPHINRKSLENIKTPVIDFHDQIRISTILSCAETIITKRKESIRLLNELLKSIFMKMFGNPVKNEKGWKLDSLDNVSSSRLGKMRDEKFITGHYLKPYIGNSNVKWFSFELTNLLEMDFNNEEQKKYSLNYGDLLICEGGEIGRCAIWKNDLSNCYFQKALHRVRVDKHVLTPEYLQYVLWFYSFLNGFKNVSTKATIAHLTGEKLKKLLIPLPPLPLQEKFTQVLDKIESVRSKYELSLREYEKLYTALCQRAFRGELDLSSIPVDDAFNPEPAKQRSEGQVPEVLPTKQFTSNELLGITGSKKGRQIISGELWGALDKASFEEPQKLDEVRDMSFDMLDANSLEFK